MAVRPIDGEALWDKLEDALWYDNYGRDIAEKIVLDMPTLTPPNEPMLERVVREYLEICGNDCAGDPSVGIPECPFYQYADVLDNGALIQTKCELAAYRRPPEREDGCKYGVPPIEDVLRWLDHRLQGTLMPGAERMYRAIRYYLGEASALSTLQAENKKLRAELEQVKAALRREQDGNNK